MLTPSMLLAFLTLLTSVNATVLTLYRVNAPPINIPRTTPSVPLPTFSIEKLGTTLYTAINPNTRSSFVPWEVKEIATRVIAYLPSTTVTLDQPTTCTYTITQALYFEQADIPPVEGPLITPASGPVFTLYEYGFQRYCSINPRGLSGECQETIVRPRPSVPTPTGPPVEAVATRTYTGSLMGLTTVYTSVPS